MRIIISLFIIFISLSAHAQLKCTIIYDFEITYVKSSDLTKLQVRHINYELIINDSLSYSWPLPDNMRKYKKNNPPGTSFEQDANYRNFKSNISITQMNPGSYDFGRYRIIDTMQQSNYEITNETKNIIGYTCYKAINFSKDSISTSEVWFAPELAAHAGLKAHGLPGVVLEESSRHIGGKITATKIQLVDRAIVEPTQGKAISGENFLQMLKSWREERRGTIQVVDKRL